MTTVRITIRDNYDETYIRVADIDITDIQAQILRSCEDYELTTYDDTWDYLTETVIPRKLGYLPPDWYVDGIEYLRRGGEQQ